MNVLYVEDDDTAFLDAEEALTTINSELTLLQATSLVDAKTVLDDDSTTIDFVVTAAQLPDGTGFDLFNFVLTYYPDIPSIIFTSDIDEELAKRRPEKILEYTRKRQDLGFRQLAQVIETGLHMDAETLYPVPEDEKERLTVLDRFDFDSFEDAAFYDRLTQLAASFFDVPMCYVGMIECDQELFLTCHGADFDPIDREQTICSFAIITDGVLVVDDVQNDPRFADVDVIHELDLAWYAAAPITVDGARIGTFCIADTEQHNLTEKDKEYLRMFADEFSEQLQHYNESYESK